MNQEDESKIISSFPEDFYLNPENIRDGDLDYLDLPQFGVQHFSLEDAALLMALDEWSRENVDDDPDFHELVACKQARDESKILSKSIEEALTQSVIQKELNAVVCWKTLPSGAPVPSRTYAHIKAIREWAKPFGLGNGHLMSNADALDDEALYVSLAVSQRRRLIKDGILPATYEVDADDLKSLSKDEIIKEFTRRIEAKNLQISHLEKKINNQINEAKPLGNRQKNNLLCLIGVMQILLLPRYKNKQDALISDIEERFGKHEGLSKRNLEAVFPQAKRMLSSD